MKDIKIPSFQDLDKILHDKRVEETVESLSSSTDDEDIDEAIFNGLEDD